MKTRSPTPSRIDALHETVWVGDIYSLGIVAPPGDQIANLLPFDRNDVEQLPLLDEYTAALARRHNDLADRRTALIATAVMPIVPCSAALLLAAAGG